MNGVQMLGQYYSDCLRDVYAALGLIKRTQPMDKHYDAAHHYYGLACDKADRARDAYRAAQVRRR